MVFERCDGLIVRAIRHPFTVKYTVKGQNMNNGHLTQKESNKIEHYEDEIELIDYLLVIWKWKYLIIIGTLVFGFSAAIISFDTRKMRII